ncbi:MAG: hypothetical protein EXS14_10315 [Planctomycetes bacterium]|nr:hypothetical protein [Planctomycetota bacterium]
MNTPRACVIVAPDEETARDEALANTVVGDHVFFALPDSKAAAQLAETFRDRDAFAASVGLDVGPRSLITSVILAHGGIDYLLVVLRPTDQAIHECEPAELLDGSVELPWNLLRAASPFLRERKGCAEFVVQGAGATAEVTAAALTALAEVWTKATGLRATLRR